ncbi:TetR/AcrR family transcriptional regulator [Alkalihalobacillus pseudalcaliphilus]|uniref:TetR/AcrR family transcriptional regulator n=1 Tax=Alkalihalobacillus pseudalcaliphilus TaxID=79884 RepID=UPI000ABA765A|nr:TetR family transcriptional regulator [Alkalihalobacillus pseudalcaliphilus]
MQTKAEQTKKHILEAATSYFLEYDFTSFTLANIAQYAKVSKGGWLCYEPLYY